MISESIVSILGVVDTIREESSVESGSLDWARTKVDLACLWDRIVVDG